jgi:hypothetical protein
MLPSGSLARRTLIGPNRTVRTASKNDPTLTESKNFDMRTLRPGSHLRTLGESVWSVLMAEGSELGVGVVDSGSVSTVWGWDGVDAENLDASHGRHCCHCETQGNSIGWHGVVLTRVGARPRSCRTACCVCFAEVAKAVNSASVDNTLKQTRQWQRSYGSTSLRRRQRMIQ